MLNETFETVVTPMENQREELVAEVIEAYEAEAVYAEEYVSSSEDSPTAQYVSDWGYDDLELDDVLESIDDDECKEVARALANKIGEKECISLIRDHCSLITAGMRLENNEIFSMIVGEQDWQVSDELEEKFSLLTDSEKAEVARQVSSGYVSNNGMVYVGSEYDRWVFQLDTDLFMEAVANKHNIKAS